ncbi:MAG: 4Fe-4S binding protein [Deltaproteobacteria bacterium]|nr:4Fe-4S binding protein [Deltaproteobacteria bacterium]
MDTLILLQSATGNTALVTEYAAMRIRAGGHACRVLDIASDQSIDLHSWGAEQPRLLGVACPTQYFRPPFAMERAVARLPDQDPPVPAFLLATAAGEPGAHFAMLARQLEAKGYQAVGAHWVCAPSDWPPHRIACLPAQPIAAAGRAVASRWPGMRLLLSLIWPDVTEPNSGDRDALDRFVDRVLDHAQHGRPAPAPESLYRPFVPGTYQMGLAMQAWQARKATAIRIDPDRCTRCGLCVKVCPVDALAWPDESQPPVPGEACTGCWACYHRCASRAISGWFSPAQLGRYRGPSRHMRSLFGRGVRST